MHVAHRASDEIASLRAELDQAVGFIEAHKAEIAELREMYEQAASELERLQQDLVFWKANSASESKARIAAETALAHPAVLVLVPREPTEAMLQAACDATFGPAMRTHEENHRLGWRAMIAAAEKEAQS